MGHNMIAMPVNPMNDKEDKGKGKIERITIEVLDDGSFYYCAYTDKGENKDYSYKTVDELLSAVKDDVKSPHLRQTNLGNGIRFKNLTAKLSNQKGIYNPAGLAAAIGRKKFGSTKFNALAAKGR